MSLKRLRLTAVWDFKSQKFPSQVHGKHSCTLWGREVAAEGHVGRFGNKFQKYLLLFLSSPSVFSTSNYFCCLFLGTILILLIFLCRVTSSSLQPSFIVSCSPPTRPWRRAVFGGSAPNIFIGVAALGSRFCTGKCRAICHTVGALKHSVSKLPTRKCIMYEWVNVSWRERCHS